MLSLFLSSDSFTDADIVDEMVDFFGAAAETSSNITTTITMHLIKNQENLQKVRQEFQKMKEEKLKENPEWQNLGKEQLLSEIVTLENCQDLSFLSKVISEALRFEPPLQLTSPMEVLKDFKAGKYYFKKGDIINPYIAALQRNSNYW